jgi:hypothetical protein
VTREVLPVILALMTDAASALEGIRAKLDRVNSLHNYHDIGFAHFLCFVLRMW